MSDETPEEVPTEESIYDVPPESDQEPQSESVVAEPETAAIVPAPKKHDRLTWARWPLFIVGGFFVFSILSVAIHRFVPVPITFLMIERLVQGNGLDHRWVSADKISDNLKAAVIASEDEKFCTHDGFDVEAIEKAQKYNATHTKKRGASTISQQTAKNVFLWPDRSWVRKGFEVWYTFLIEHMWPKDRILEVYLNSVEWAPGVYGAEAASQHWFHHSAATLSKAEAAKLAAILPSPLTYKTTGSYVVRQSGTIQARARAVDTDGLDACAAD
ncbi:MAG: monofunctional biosynthetic peptidoglycan transglycosylase [Asticcacaulis sp.]